MVLTLDDDRGMWLPDGVAMPEPIASPPLAGGASRGVVVNETDLPDHVVMAGVESYFEENASMLGANSGTTFQRYTNRSGSLLARESFRVPSNVIDEIILSRDLIDRDDDVGATMRAMLATAFADGMQHSHEDEVIIAMFDEIASNAGFDTVLQDLYREWIISQSMTTVSAFVRDDFHFTPEGADRQRQRSIVAPLIGVLPAELIRIVGNDLFQTGTLAYRPSTSSQDQWLREFFAPHTSAARKAEMRAQDPVLAAMVVEALPEEDPSRPTYQDEYDANLSGNLYRLNPRMVHRTSAPKGSWKYPRPLLTRNFALLEAKRLLNLMDYALLQGGANFLVVAKKGTDQRPALPAEVNQLREQVRRTTRTGVMVGDHRLSIEIITPELKELLNGDKRNLLGRKIAASMLGLPQLQEQGEGSQAVLAGLEILARVISLDRRMTRRHVERHIYRETVRRNSNVDHAPAIWFPRIVLSELRFFTDMVLKLYDRGAISRKAVVQVAGFDYTAEKEQKKREKSQGDDRFMIPPGVPFDTPNRGQPGQPAGPPNGPGDNPSQGRPRAGNQPDPAHPSRVINRNQGETVRARYDDDTGTYRVGEVTERVLEDHADILEEGRITASERRALLNLETGAVGTQEVGSYIVVPVNEGEVLTNLRAVRLGDNGGMIVGDRADDDALMARALTYRGATRLDAEECTLRLGYEIIDTEERQRLEEEQAAAAAPAPPVEVHIHVSDEVANREGDPPAPTPPEPTPPEPPAPEPPPAE